MRLIYRLMEKLRVRYYKGMLEDHVGRKLPTVRVMGPVFFENGELELGENVILYPNVTFAGNGKITVGNGCKIGTGVIIYAHKDGGVEIGNDTLIAAQSYLIDSNHSVRKNQLIAKQALTSEILRVGSDVWIGADTTVVKGAEIRDGAVIGAKSLVNGRIPEYQIAFGVPAKEIRERE